MEICAEWRENSLSRNVRKIHHYSPPLNTEQANGGLGRSSLNSNHYHHNPYQYVHVQHPGIFEWGYNRGNHEGHTRSQVLKQKHHNHFQSEVNYLICFLKSCSISIQLNGNKWESEWNLNGNWTESQVLRQKHHNHYQSKVIFYSI